MAPKFELSTGRWIGEGFPCYIIAEIGQNHQGSVETAKKLMKVAKDCGADCVKFQKSDFGAKFTRSVLSRRYDSPHAFGSTYGEHKQFLEFSIEQYEELIAYANSLSIDFSASAMDEISLDVLVQLKVPFIKIGSGDANNLPFLVKAAKTQLPIIYSTGMQDLVTVTEAMSQMSEHNSRICILQCTSAYPTPVDQVNLRVMQTYRDLFPANAVGYSGHELGLNISLAAAALGADVIERHITLDKSSKGNDHACSLDPAELKSLVEGIRHIERALGDGVKAKQPSEEACHQKLGKSVVTRQKLTAGTRLTYDHLTVKVGQPVGWPPQHIHQLIDRAVSRDVDVDVTITEDVFE